MTLHCPHCNTDEEPTLEANAFQGEIIKTGFNIKALCSSCGKYVKFLKQTPEALALLDKQLNRM